MTVEEKIKELLYSINYYHVVDNYDTDIKYIYNIKILKDYIESIKIIQTKIQKLLDSKIEFKYIFNVNKYFGINTINNSTIIDIVIPNNIEKIINSFKIDTEKYNKPIYDFIEKSKKFLIFINKNINYLETIY